MLEKEIGSNFYKTIPASMNSITDKNNLYFFDSCRSCLEVILQKVRKKNLKVLLPLYICESVIRPFEKHNCEILFYKVNTKFEIVEHDFERKIEMFQPELIYIHAYFGFHTFFKMEDKINQLHRQGMIIIEDITHSMFSDIKHLEADFYVGSLRKWCSLPDGGILKVVSDNWKKNFPIEEGLSENSSFLEKRIKAQNEKEKYFCGQGKEKQIFIQLFDESEKILDKQSEVYTLSQYSRRRIASVDWEFLKSKRYKNYKYLEEKLKNIPQITLAIPQIKDNEIPLYCPVYVKNQRNELRLFARERNVMLPVIWPVPEMVESIIDGEVKWIYEHILAIPCDQRYTREDMETIITIINLFYN